MPGPQARLPWEELERIFVYGEEDEEGRPRTPSTRELARRYGCAETTIRQYANAHGWPEKRAEWASHLEQSRRNELENRERQAVLALRRIDAAAERISERGLGIVGARLAELAQLQIRRQNGEVLENGAAVRAVDHRELSGLALAAGRFQAMALRAAGLNPDEDGPESHAEVRLADAIGAWIAGIRDGQVMALPPIVDAQSRDVTTNGQA